MILKQLMFFFKNRSKHMYEILYNRINSDLLMWEASAPSYTALPKRVTHMATSLVTAGMNESLYVPFSMCKSGINYESSSSTTASESESDNDIYYSITADQQCKKSLVASAKKTLNSSLAFRLQLGQAIITTYSPVRVSVFLFIKL